MTSNRPFPETLTHLLEIQEVSGREVGRRTGLSSVAVNEMRRGLLRPSMGAISLIATALGVRPETFAEYRLGIVREELDPGAVGLKVALRNLDRLTGKRAAKLDSGSSAGKAAEVARQARAETEKSQSTRRSRKQSA